MTHMISVYQLISLLVCAVFFLISLNIILDHIDVGDRPDPLRFTEILIIISILLLWCASICMFIRHSQLLRIRHRDLPYRPTVKSQSIPSATNLSRVSVLIRNSEASVQLQPKSRISSISVLTPPVNRQAHPFEFNVSAASKSPVNKRNDKEYLLHSNQNVSNRKSIVIQLQQNSCENLSTADCSTFPSANDMSRQTSHDSQSALDNERCTHESPV